MGYDRNAMANLVHLTGLPAAKIKQAWYASDIDVLLADKVDGDTIRRLTLNQRARVEWRLQRRGFAAFPNDPDRHRVPAILGGAVPEQSGESRGVLPAAGNGAPAPSDAGEERPAPENGYVYILVNPTFANYVKIGKTTKDPEMRAREISSGTGVPAPYSVAWDVLVHDCHEAERAIHRELAQYRARNDREFFALPLKQAIAAVQRLTEGMAVEDSKPGEQGA